MVRLNFILIIVTSVLFCTNFARSENIKWWNKNYFYELYIKSFKDSDGDGFGDIKGIIEKIDHIKTLKVNTIILSPIFQINNICKDGGYTNFKEIEENLGALEDLDNLITTASKLDMNIILDMPINQISETSQWFTLSLSRTPKYDNFFVWRPQSNDGSMEEQNETGWKWNTERNEFYYIVKDYPILNYSDPNLLNEMIDVIVFWLQRGVTGFRITETSSSFVDNDTYLMVKFLRVFLDDYSRKNGGLQRILVGQFPNDAKMVYKSQQYSSGSYHLIMPKGFFTAFQNDFNALDVKFSVDTTLTYTKEDESPIWNVGNADTNRISTRAGISNAEIISIIAFVLPGSLVIYQGDEIGMMDLDEPETDSTKCWTKQSRDLISKNPFLWDDSTNAGFSSCDQTWLPISKGYRMDNLKKQISAPKSRYKIFAMLGKMRRSKILQDGDSHIAVLSEHVLVLTRNLDNYDSIVVLANLGPYAETVDLTKARGIPRDLTAILSSERSIYEMGDKVPFENLRLSSGECILIVGQYKECSNVKPVDKIVTKISEAVNKMNKYLNI